jgi:hypothetical protein
MIDLRHLENVVIDEAVLHVLDTTLDEPLLGTAGLNVERDEVLEFVTKHILKALQDDAAFKARFLPDTIMIKHGEGLMSQETFLMSSHALAHRLFEIVKQSKEPSCDILAVRFHTGNLQCYGLIKLDYQLSYTHEIAFHEDVFTIDLVAQEIALPTQQQKVAQAYFGLTYQEDAEYHVIVLNKKRSSDEEEKEKFVKVFLNAQREFDYKDKTKTLRKTVEEWTQKHLKEDFDTARDLRKTLDEKMRYHAVIAPEELLKTALGHDTDARYALKQKLEQQGIDPQDQIEIDKRFVDKKMKTKTVRTDTGFVIRGDFELFEDDGFIEVQRNGDGTVNYLIKHVRFVKET